MHAHHRSLRTFIARLLAVVLLALGATGPTLALADTLSDHAPDWCGSSLNPSHHAPDPAATALDLADDSFDLEQLLRPSAAGDNVPHPLAANFPPPPTLLPPHYGQPLLRPPASRS